MYFFVGKRFDTVSKAVGEFFVVKVECSVGNLVPTQLAGNVVVTAKYTDLHVDSGR